MFDISGTSYALWGLYISHLKKLQPKMCLKTLWKCAVLYKILFQGFSLGVIFLKLAGTNCLTSVLSMKGKFCLPFLHGEVFFPEESKRFCSLLFCNTLFIFTCDLVKACIFCYLLRLLRTVISLVASDLVSSWLGKCLSGIKIVADFVKIVLDLFKISFCLKDSKITCP